MDNISYKTAKKGLIIVGGPRSGKTRLIHHLMDMHHIDEVFITDVSPQQLAKGILPWGIITAPRLKRLIVLEGVTALSQALAAVKLINPIYLSRNRALPLTVFTSQGLPLLDIQPSTSHEFFDFIQIDEVDFLQQST